VTSDQNKIKICAMSLYSGIVFEIVGWWNCHLWPNHSQNAWKWKSQEAAALRPVTTCLQPRCPIDCYCDKCIIMYSILLSS